MIKCWSQINRVRAIFYSLDFTQVEVVEVEFSLCSTVHTVSALEHPLSAVLKDVLNSTITPVRGQPGLFRILGVYRSSAQITLKWQFINVSCLRLMQ